MYEDKSEEVFNQDPKLDSNYYKTYFYNRDHFYVHVTTKEMINDLSFIDTPVPYNVSVNGQEWWLTNINYTYKNDGIVLTKVPAGHSYVDIYFQSNSMNAPVAAFTVSKRIVGVGETVKFDASTSYDPDGTIDNYLWDFSEGTYKIGVVTEHKFMEEGVYNTILTVRDNNHLINRAMLEITVVRRIMSISKSVDKPIATPGAVLTYTITITINNTWIDGVKNVVITDTLSESLEYVDATPLPELTGRTLKWRLGSALNNDDLQDIILKAKIKENVPNSTMISNFALLDYQSSSNLDFPQEMSNTVEIKVNIGTILAPRIKQIIPDIELQEDDPPYHLNLAQYEYDMQDYGFDLQWYVTNKNESLYILSGEYSSKDIITITPVPNAYGNSLVTLWLVDSDGYTTSQPLWINISSVNDYPVFSRAPDLIIHYDEKYIFDYDSYISDIDTDKDQIQLFTTEKIGELNGDQPELPTQSIEVLNDYIKVDGFKVTYNFPQSYVDIPIFVSLIVYDGSDTDSDTIQINITDDYTPNLRLELPDVHLFEGETKYNVFNLDDYFDDPDGDSLFFSYGETFVTVTIHDNHTVDFSSDTDWYGVDTVTFRARDPIGAIAEDTISITVTPINDPPEISGVPETFIVHYESDYSFDLTPYVSDKDNETEELYLIHSDLHIRTDPLNRLRIIMNYPKEMVGLEIPVILIISDGIATGSQTIRVKITSSWPPEIRKTLPDVSFHEDQVVINEFNLNNYFQDKDSDTLYYSYGNEFVNVTIHSNYSVDFSAVPNWHGVEIVTFRATDPTSAFVENMIRVTVIPVNDPPVIKPLPSQQIMVREFLKFDISGFISDIDDNVTELTISAESEKLEVLLSGQKLVIFSDKPLIDIVKITVSDGREEVVETMLIEVSAEDSGTDESVSSLMSILWLLVLIILIIISLTGYANYRKYVGDYNIEEIFWIYDNGLLITHVTPRRTKRKADKEIVSGMLTAILDFSEDAFTEEDILNTPCRIKEIQMDGKNILVERGKFTFLATVFSGKSGKKLHKKSSMVINNLEDRYHKVLRSWNGETNELAGGKLIIKTGLMPESKLSSTKLKDIQNKKEPIEDNEKAPIEDNEE
jgi:uncharacterized repeat protein (TIGR01451 family)